MGEYIRTRINGVDTEVHSGGSTPLSTVLRDELGLTGTKVGCGSGDCGACTVLVDDAPICSCLTPVGQVEGRHVLTVEGLAGDGLGERLQRSFLAHGAAQCGFCTPGMLMAARALVGRTTQPTSEAVEEALGGVLCRCTGYRPIVEALVDFDVNAPKVEAPVGGAVGASIERLDGPERVSGAALFGADAVPRNALVMRIVRSPFAHASFTIGDLEEYQTSHPDVRLVLTARDVTGLNKFGVIPGFFDQPVYAEGETRFHGEAVAAVVFETGSGAAIEDFPVRWRELPAISSIDEALDPVAPLVLAERPGNVLVEGYAERGDVDRALADAAVVVHGEFTTPFIEHAYIEPEAGWAQMDGEVVVIHACTQAAYMDRTSTALVLGVPEEQVRVVPTEVGGGFGGKLDVAVQPHLALAARRLNQPVALIYDRRESMMSTTKRHPSLMRVRVGANSDGRIVAMDFDGSFNTGAYASWGPTVANRVPVHASGPYVTSNYRARTRAVLTHAQPAGAFRGFGVPQATIAQEVLYDDLAYALGMDRLALRRMNVFEEGDATVTGQRLIGGVGIGACLDALGENWRTASARVREEKRDSTSRYRTGVGLACIWYGCGNTSLSNPSNFKAGVRRDGTVVLHQGAIDIGQGSTTVITQMFADALGVPVGDVERVSGDTALTPDAGKTSASRQTYVSGMAATRVGRALRKVLTNALGVDAEAPLRFDGSSLVASVPSGNVKLDLSSVSEIDGYAFVATESFDPPTSPLDARGQGDPYAVYGFGAQMVELRVDVNTGRVYLDKITAAYDVGRAINPRLVVGQIEGGIAQGIGLGLLEDYVPQRTNNLHDYLIPTLGDVPVIESLLIESNDPGGPYGAKGVGEHTIIGTAPAILNAIRDAVGARITSVPATPERVLRAMEGQS